MRWLCFFGVHELEDKDRFSNLLDDTWIKKCKYCNRYTAYCHGIKTNMSQNAAKRLIRKVNNIATGQ